MNGHLYPFDIAVGDFEGPLVAVKVSIIHRHGKGSIGAGINAVDTKLTPCIGLRVNAVPGRKYVSVGSLAAIRDHDTCNGLPGVGVHDPAPNAMANQSLAQDYVDIGGLASRG